MWSSSVYKKRWKKQAIFIPRQNASYTHLVNNIVYSNEAAKTILFTVVKLVDGCGDDVIRGDGGPTYQGSTLPGIVFVDGESSSSLSSS